MSRMRQQSKLKKAHWKFVYVKFLWLKTLWLHFSSFFVCDDNFENIHYFWMFFCLILFPYWVLTSFFNSKEACAGFSLAYSNCPMYYSSVWGNLKNNNSYLITSCVINNHLMITRQIANSGLHPLLQRSHF